MLKSSGISRKHSQDDRVLSVDDMNITFTGEQAVAEFTVRSVYGAFNMIKEVREDG